MESLLSALDLDVSGYYQIISLRSQNGFDPDLALMAAQEIMKILLDPEKSPSISMGSRITALDKITDVIIADPLLFDATLMLIGIARLDDSFSSRSDLCEKWWPNDKTKALANAIKAATRYEKALRDDIEKSPQEYKQSEEIIKNLHSLQYDIFRMSAKIFQDAAATNSDNNIYVRNEGRLLQYVVNKIVSVSDRPEILDDLREVLVKVAIDRPKVVEIFLDTQQNGYRSEYPYGYYACDEVRGWAGKQLEAFSSTSKRSRLIEDVTHGFLATDPHSGSIASLSDLKRQRHNPLSILAV